MFQALDDQALISANSNLQQLSAPNSGRSSHNNRDMENLSRQFQEQQAERVKELETLVVSKEQEIAQFRINEIQMQQRHQLALDEQSQSRKGSEGQVHKLERTIKEREYELERLVTANRRLEDEVKHLSEKLSSQEKGY